MAEVHGLMIQWVPRGCRAQVNNIFGGLDLEVLLAHRTGKTGQKSYYHKQQTYRYARHYKSSLTKQVLSISAGRVKSGYFLSETDWIGHCIY
jgi:hypothetical protein